MTEKTTTCPQCKEEIIKGAKKCKHCGADLRNRFTKHPILTLFLCMFVFGPFLGGLIMPKQDGYVETTPSNVQEKTFTKDGIELCIYAQKRVEETVKPNLKDPNSLKLPTCSNDPNNTDHFIVKAPDGGFLYESYYMSNNSFGQSVRRDYSCAIQYQIYPNYTINCGFVEE